MSRFQKATKRKKKKINLDVVDRVHVLHAIRDNPATHLEPLEVPHDADCVSLDQHVTAGQELDGLKRVAIWAKQPLAPFHELVLVPQQVSDLYNIASSPILQNSDGLRRQQTALSDQERR